jgi:CheY-like chemotaxis protein
MKNQQNIRILLVDDEMALLEFLSKRLLKKGFTLKAIFSGGQRFNYAELTNFLRPCRNCKRVNTFKTLL